VLDRFDSLMATGESRHAAKLALRAAGGRAWSLSDGRIHAFRTRKGYQAIVLRLVNWDMAHGLHFRTLAELDVRADELVTRYLQQRLAAGKSAWTLKTERSAFRLFFGRPDLATDVALPPRRREHIRRSRGPAQRDRDFDPAHWHDLLTFVDATGLRRGEFARLRVRDVAEDGTEGGDGHLRVAVKGKGGRRRLVPIFPTNENALRELVAGRPGEDLLFTALPSHLDIHAHRRMFAQAAYRQHSGDRPLPPAQGRLPRGAIDEAAARRVSQALGHNRLDVTTTHYLR
jgi:integrase